MITCFLSCSGTWLKHSQACQNKMFSSLNSFFRNSCRSIEQYIRFWLLSCDINTLLFYDMVSTTESTQTINLIYTKASLSKANWPLKMYLVNNKHMSKTNCSTYRKIADTHRILEQTLKAYGPWCNTALREATMVVDARQTTITFQTAHAAAIMTLDTTALWTGQKVNIRVEMI